MTKEDIIYIAKIAAIPIVIVIISIIVLVAALRHQEKNVDSRSKSNDIPIETQSEIVNEMDALALVLTLPKDVAERSFNEMYKYTGGILQSANLGVNKHELKFSDKALEALLNRLGYWNEDPELFGTLNDFLEERDRINNLSKDEIDKMTTENNNEEYKKYIANEQYKYNPEVVVKRVYNDNIVYVLKNKDNKYVVTLITDSSGDKIDDFKVVDDR